MNEILLNGSNIGTRVQHDTGESAAALAVSTAAFSNANVAIGYTVYNQTDASSATVTSVTATTVVGTLAGGGENDWDVDDYGNVPGVNRHVVNVDGFENASIHYRLTSGSANNILYMKIYGSNNPLADENDDTHWVNLSLDLLGAAAGITATNETVEDILFIDTDTIVRSYMVKIVSECATGAFANSYYIYIKKA